MALVASDGCGSLAEVLFYCFLLQPGMVGVLVGAEGKCFILK